MEKENHPSQIQILFNRCNSSVPESFYGSDIKCSSYITLTISSSVKERRLNNDNFHTQKVLVKIRLSPNQFSEAITAFGQGGGVPATLEFFNTNAGVSGRIDSPPSTDKREEFEQEIEVHADKIVGSLQNLKSVLETIDIKKKDRDKLKTAFNLFENEALKNLPFILQQAKKQLDKVITSAKSVVESYYQNICTRLGVKAIQQQIDMGLGVKEIEEDKGGKND